MPSPPDLRAAGDRIEGVLDDLRATVEPRAYARVEELVRLVTDLYGAALARMVELAGQQTPALTEALAADDLIASLLVVHGLHPVPLDRRVAGALDQVRPLLAAHGGDVELLAVDEAAGAVLIRLLGSCDGCPSSSVTLKEAVERAIVAAAPEILRIDVDDGPAPTEGVPITLGAKPVFEACPVAGG